VETGYAAGGSNCEKAPASVIPACYADPVEVSVGALHDAYGASPISILEAGEHVVILRLRYYCRGNAENQKDAGATN
jgi:hypothetical protein